eukprot:873717_1
MGCCSSQPSVQAEANKIDNEYHKNLANQIGDDAAEILERCSNISSSLKSKVVNVVSDMDMADKYADIGFNADEISKQLQKIGREFQAANGVYDRSFFNEDRSKRLKEYIAAAQELFDEITQVYNENDVFSGIIGSDYDE